MKFQRFVSVLIIGAYFAETTIESIINHEPIELEDGITPVFQMAVNSGTSSFLSAYFTPPFKA